MRSLSWYVALFVVLVAAQADARPRCKDEPWFSGPVVDEAAGLELVEADTVVSCDGPRSRMRCHVDASWVVRNPGEQRVAIPAATWASEGLVQRVLVDGATPRSAAPPRLTSERQLMSVEDREGGHPAGFVLELDARASVRIDVRTDGLHENTSCGSVTMIEHRHRLVSSDLTPQIVIADQRDDGFVYPAGLEPGARVHVPAGWRLARRWLRRDHDSGRGWWRPRGNHITFIRRAPLVRWGGPFVGAGVWGDGRHSEPRLRAGWDIGFARRLIASVAVESDARHHVDVVPTLELGRTRWARRGWLWIPTPTLGLGAPVRAWPTTRAGVRTQVGVHWPFVGLVIAFDAYPRTPTEHARYLGGAALQLQL